MEAEKALIQALPKSTVRLIGSAQVITSAVSVVKELVENSLDAGATTLDIKLEGYGFDKIEVRDNGHGIKKSDTAAMGLPHHTSKIANTADLTHLQTYGFRGEALGSLCAVSRVNITTKTADEDVSVSYDLGQDGNITDQKPSHLGQGTTVTAVQLFHNVPVRRQYYSTAKRKKEELKKVEDLIIAYSVIKHDVRFVLRHNRDVIWQKTSLSSMRHSLLKVFGSSALSLMIHKQTKHDDTECEIELYIPRPDTDCHVMSRTSSERCFVFINQRPVIHKDISKALKQAYCESTGCETSRWPLSCLSIKVPPSTLDVNLEPNKTRVLLEQNADIISLLGEVLNEVYGKKETMQGDNTGEGHPPVTNGQNPRTQQEELIPEISYKPHGNGQHADIQLVCDGVTPQNQQNGDEALQTTINSSTSSSASISADDQTNTQKSITGEITLPLRKPLHNSTQFDVSTSSVPVCTQNITFDLLKDFNDTGDDVFSDLTENFTMPSSMDVSTPSRVEKEQGGDSLTANYLSLDESNSERKTGLGRSEVTPELPSVSSDMLEVGNFKEPGSKVVRRTDIEGSDSRTSAKEWTRGESVVSDKNGKTVQPVQLLIPGASPAASIESPCGKSQRPADVAMSKIKRAADSPGQMTLMDISNISTIKKPTTAFIFFSKEMRPTVVAENPDANFETVAKLIGERWKTLSLEQRDKYEKMMTKDVERYRQEVSTSKDRDPSNISIQPNKKRKLSMSNRSIQGMLKSPEPSPRRHKKSKPHQRKSASVRFSMSMLKDQYSGGPIVRDDSVLRLIGEVKPDGWWVGIKDDTLIGVAPWRLQETQICTQLMENHSIPTNKLDDPIVLSPEVLGEDLWTLLLTLPSMMSYQSDSFSYFTDPRISRSGFSIRRSQGYPPRVEITSMTAINSFDVSDLSEILKIIRDSPSVSVTDSRPRKVKHFLQSEAMRMTRQMPSRVTKEEVHDLISRAQKRVPQLIDGACFHQRPFTHTVYSLSDLPLSQISTQTEGDT